jgi:DNA invertase Pin-like site-specific DNA recombinase
MSTDFESLAKRLEDPENSIKVVWSTPEELAEQVIGLYRQKGNGGWIAEKLGITNYMVYKCLRANGIEPKKVGGKEKHSVKKMVDMYKDGMSTSQIAKELNMNHVSVWERLKKHGNGIMLSQADSCRKFNSKIVGRDYLDIVKRYKEGESSSDIAKDYEVHKTTITKILHDFNVPIRDMHGSNNHQWKGGRVNLNKLIRNSSIYVQFRDDILKSRDYTCEVSGDRGGRLNVHHKIFFSKLIGDFLDANPDLDWEDESKRQYLYNQIEVFAPFWDESNVIVIREDLHKAIHQCLGKDDD